VELLFGEKLFPVLVLPLELFIGGLNCRFLPGKLPYLFFEDVHLLSFLHAASHGTFPVLKTFSSLLVLRGVFKEIVVSASVVDLLLHVLLLLFGIATDERWVAVGVFTLLFFTGC